MKGTADNLWHMPGHTQRVNPQGGGWQMDGVVGKQMPGTEGDEPVWFFNTCLRRRCGNGKLENCEATGSMINNLCNFRGSCSMVILNLVVGIDLLE